MGMEKTCTKCGETKDIDEFYRDRRKRIGRRSRCKSCCADYQRAYEQTERGRAVRKVYAQSEARRAWKKAYNRSEKAKEMQRAWETSAKGRSKRKSYQPSEKALARKRARSDVYRKSDSGKAVLRAYQKKRRASDPAYRLRSNISSMACNALRAAGRSKAGQSTFAHLPYAPQELREHLESLWEPWMTWDNYGREPGNWTIDHIVPQSSFRYTSLEDPQFRECWALTNLRPLGFIANCRKGDRVA